MKTLKEGYMQKKLALENGENRRNDEKSMMDRYIGLDLWIFFCFSQKNQKPPHV